MFKGVKNLNELDYSLKEFLKTGKPFVIRNPCGIHKILQKYKIKNQEIGKKSYMLTKEELNTLYSLVNCCFHNFIPEYKHGCIISSSFFMV